MHRLVVLFAVACSAAHAAHDPFDAPIPRERDEQRAIVADSGGDATTAYDLALRRSLYFRAIGAEELGARLAEYAAGRAPDADRRAQALLEAALLYRRADATRFRKAIAADLARAERLIAGGWADTRTLALARTRLAIQRSYARDDAATRLTALLDGDDAQHSDAARFVVAATLSTLHSDAQRLDAARAASDTCWALIDAVDDALPERQTCLLQRAYVLHAVDANGTTTEAVVVKHRNWLDARVGKTSPALVLTLANYCNLSFPDPASYVRSEAACQIAQKLLEHPDIASRHTQYAFQLTIGRGLAIQNQTGRARDALPYLSQALSIATLSKKDDDIRNALINLGWAQFQAGDAEAARLLLERLPREAPDSFYTIIAQLSLGDIACNAGDYDGARRHFDAGAALADKLGETTRRGYFVERVAMLQQPSDRCNTP